MVVPPTKWRKEDDVFFKGKVKHVRNLTPDFKFDPAGKWSMVIYLTGEELDKFRLLQAEHGIKNTLKKDEDGWFSTLSRKCSYTVQGRNIGREPPEVFRLGELGPDGQRIHIPITERVGNGSDGIAKCVLWGSPKYPGKNLRWEALRVDNLVAWTPSKDYPDGGESLQDLKAVPKQEVWE